MKEISERKKRKRRYRKTQYFSISHSPFNLSSMACSTILTIASSVISASVDFGGKIPLARRISFHSVSSSGFYKNNFVFFFHQFVRICAIWGEHELTIKWLISIYGQYFNFTRISSHYSISFILFKFTWLNLPTFFLFFTILLRFLDRKSSKISQFSQRKLWIKFKTYSSDFNECGEWREREVNFIFGIRWF